LAGDVTLNLEDRAVPFRRLFTSNVATPPV
jgi:hypothetical protein